jgi:hypothetical protein
MQPRFRSLTTLSFPAYARNGASFAVALLLSTAAGCTGNIEGDSRPGVTVPGQDAEPSPPPGAPVGDPGTSMPSADAGAVGTTVDQDAGPRRRRRPDSGVVPPEGPEDAGASPVDAGGGSTGATPTPPVSPSVSVCTSGQHSRGTGPLMLAGADCTRCHRFRIAGTVYPTAHEPNSCYGSSGATVIIVDASGQMFMLSANQAGNFYSNASPTPPLKIAVLAGGKMRQMVTMAPRSNCNSCHTETGANAAPGRIMLP